MGNISVLRTKAIDFFKTGIWRIRLKELPRLKAVAIKQLRIVLLATRKFAEDKCPLRASALTFYSLLSIVPVAAMAFGIAKGFGFAKRLEILLYENFSAQKEVMTQVINFANSLLENTRGGIIAGIGIALLFWSVIKVLHHIENSFNTIWEVDTPRTVGRKITDYLSIMLICPILIIMSSSVTVFITTQVTLITEQVSLLGMFSPVIFLVLRLLPYCLIWILFITIYIFMPNTHVNLSTGIISGVIAGTIFQIVQFIYISSQVLVAKYNAIYGSFAALPLFLIWLQVSWFIVLLGAEVSYAYQNVDTYEFEPDTAKISPAFKKLITLQISHRLVKNFSNGEKPLTADQIANTLEIPVRLVWQILDDLVDSGVFSVTESETTKDAAFQPARDINLFTIKYVMEALDHRGVDDLPLPQTGELQTLSASLNTFGDIIENSPENRLLKDI
ncbi:MAG: YihY/virulence factor BrkB family protein [Deltaproteobacteria bacterium]|nr:YihY/virulence factor BrkB family protein [Deltaproteobacteria bacterium]MBW2193478.1 YihY/virulence factor BrkB family protein [Deltaproteobacteria bacterium]